MPTWNPVRLSAMHRQHLELGAVMVESDGWQRPARYIRAEQELQQLQKAVGLCDISPVGKLSLQGDDLDSLLNAAFPDMRPLDPGAVSQQGIGSEPALQSIVLARLAEDEALVLTDPNRAPSVAETLGERPHECTHIVDITSALAAVRITGPLGHLLLASVSELDTASEVLPNMSCAQARIAEIHVMLLRLDVGDLPSYELYFGREFGEYMWDALTEAGHEYQAMPFGIEASARLQARG